MDKNLENFVRLEARMDRIINWVKTCDTKTSIMLTLTGVLLPIIFSSDIFQNDFMTAFHQISNSDCRCVNILCWSYVILIFLFSTSLILAARKFLKVLFAKRTETLNEQMFGLNRDSLSGIMKKSLIHFHHISTLSYIQFQKAINEESEEQYFEDLCSQIYINAKRCEEKFRDYNDGIRMVYLSGIFLIIVYLLHIILF